MRVLSASGDRTLREWNAVTGDELRRFEGHADLVFACSYSPDEAFVLSGSADKTLREWHRVTGRERRRFTGHSDQVFSCAYSPDGSRVLSGSVDRTLREWDRESGKEVRRFPGNEEVVAACGYSSDGARIFSSSGEWDALTGDQRARFNDAAICAYSPDGTRILCLEGGSASEMEAATRKELRRFEAHFGPMFRGVYSRDGACVVLTSGQTLGVWSCATGECLDTVCASTTFICVSTSPGTIAAGDALGNVWVLDCDWI
jgi:WD40 repeat protein